MNAAAHLAALDASLLANRAPADLQAALVAAGVKEPSRLFETPAGPTVIDDYKAEVAGNQSRFSGHRFANALSKGALYGAGGVLVGAVVAIPGAPLLVGAAALVYGAASDWRATTQRSTGTVDVEVDGVQSTARYIGSPNIFERSPAELRAELYAAGVLGDRIAPLQAHDAELPQLRLATLTGIGKQGIAELSRLVKSRRLVADFGGRSRYDKRVLQLVSLVTAMRLLDAKRPMFVVSGQSLQETPHVYTTNARRADNAVQTARRQDYVERTFAYTLTPFAVGATAVGATAVAATTADAAAASTGVPYGMNGVAATGGSFTDVISAAEHKTYHENSSDPDHKGTRTHRHIASRASGHRALSIL